MNIDKSFYNDARGEKLAYYGWSCSEDNLNTLPKTAPVGAQNLAQWLTLEGRRSSLAEWIGQTKDDGKIHGTIRHIGAWTGRCSHQGPNTANISSPFHGEVRSAVDQVKSDYDASMRALWRASEGSWLVGTDLEGIQLRVLADWLWRHFDTDAYAVAICEGNKADETDIHNLNKKALGVTGITRDTAKTFIYAYVLNAGPPKIANILGVNVTQAIAARDRFEASIEGLVDLKNKLIPYIANQGHFTGYDGRLVKVPSAHKTLAGILQNGEAVVMKYSIIRWQKDAKADGINFKIVGVIHDETQTEVYGTKEEAERLGFLQRKAITDVGIELGVKCPLAGSTDIGVNWLETH